MSLQVEIRDFNRVEQKNTFVHNSKLKQDLEMYWVATILGKVKLDYILNARIQCSSRICLALLQSTQDVAGPVLDLQTASNLVD